jgi:hypothetical protein
MTGRSFGRPRPFCYTDGLFPQISRAGEWFLRSGVQTPDGGVARYCRLDLARNHAASTEITGYSASTFVFLHSLTKDQRYLDRAHAAARFLTSAWDATSRSMPFEIAPAEYAYFFDCGIIVRGLLSVWRVTGESEFLDCACAVGQSMAHDFAAPGGQFHPVLTLPDKRPLERDPLRWSRSTGCYQLKAGMAWWDLWEITGDLRYRQLYEGLLEDSLHTYADFLPGHPDQRKVVDRLHAFLYFLEGLLPLASDAACTAALSEGIQSVARYLREFAPEFERSDIYAQLLRVRLYADCAGVVPLDHAAAPWEASRLLEFAASADDARVDGGFYFGRTAGAWEPFINPVSTAFALQALALWNHSGQAHRHRLI